MLWQKVNYGFIESFNFGYLYGDISLLLNLMLEKCLIKRNAIPKS